MNDRAIVATAQMDGSGAVWVRVDLSGATVDLRLKPERHLLTEAGEGVFDGDNVWHIRDTTNGSYSGVGLAGPLSRVLSAAALMAAGLTLELVYAAPYRKDAAPYDGDIDRLQRGERIVLFRAD